MNPDQFRCTAVLKCPWFSFDFSGGVVASVVDEAKLKQLVSPYQEPEQKPIFRKCDDPFGNSLFKIYGCWEATSTGNFLMR